VLQGRVSRAAARHDYGVVIVGSEAAPQVDARATARLRAALRRRRPGRRAMIDRGPGFASMRAPKRTSAKGSAGAKLTKRRTR
jgi:hypothetical protein